MARTSFAAKADRWYRRITGAQTPEEALAGSVDAVRALAIALDDSGSEEEAAGLRTDAASALTGVFVRHIARLGITVPSEPAPIPERVSPQ